MKCWNCNEDDFTDHYMYMYNGHWWCRDCIEEEIKYLKKLINESI